MIIAVDVDGVVADLDKAWLERYNRDYQDNVQPSDLKRWAIHEFVKAECGKKIYDYLDDRSLYDDVLPVPGALEGVNELRTRGHRVIFVTSSPSKSGGRKREWLVEHGFLQHRHIELDYFECSDKTLIKADMLIDDGFHNVAGFPRFAVLFNRPWNRENAWSDRLDGWGEIAMFSDKHFIGPHPTEVKRPIQTQAFQEILNRMYRVHLDKNADYSPANILGTGWIGLVTRLWDKMARMMNLAGFRIEIASSEYEAPQAPRNESIDDTLMDMAVYAIIGLLLRQGKWGK